VCALYILLQMQRPVLFETVSSGLAAESRDNVRFKVTDVSTRLQGCPSRVSSFRFLPLVSLPRRGGAEIDIGDHNLELY